MKDTKFVFYIAKILIILLLLQNYDKNILTFAIAIISISMIFILKPYFLEFDKNNKLILLFMLVAIISLIFNLKNYNFVAYSFYYKTGEYSNNVYFKIAVNVIIWFILVNFNYNFGKVIADNENELNKFLSFIMNVFFINGITNVFVWFMQTGGVISRYNFISPITNTPSAGIELSILGFFLSIVLPNKNRFISIIYKIIFLINILIIVTRQEQIFFILCLGYYSLLVFKKFKGKRILVILTYIFLGIFIILSARYFVSTYTNYYANIFNSEGIDMLSRKIANDSALSLFHSSPIVGIGYGMFAALNTEGLRGVILNSPHSGIYSILSEWGVIGSILTSILFINILLVTHKMISKGIETKKIHLIYVIFLRGIIILFFISNSTLFPPPSERAYYLYGSIMWIFFGICNQHVTKKYKTVLN
jgi:hypothetical protein